MFWGLLNFDRNTLFDIRKEMLKKNINPDWEYVQKLQNGGKNTNRTKLNDQLDLNPLFAPQFENVPRLGKPVLEELDTYTNTTNNNIMSTTTVRNNNITIDKFSKTTKKTTTKKTTTKKTKAKK